MEKLNNLADVISFLGNRAERADKVIKETKEMLAKRGWDTDKEIAKGKRQIELLKEGKKPSEVLEIIKKEFDTNNNGKIEKSEMDCFTDSLNDYMDKNKKGRDDIPVTTRR